MIPNVTAVRWYFEGFNNQTAGVAMPDELPRNESWVTWSSSEPRSLIHCGKPLCGRG